MSTEFSRLATRIGARQISRRGVLKGAAGLGAAAASAAYAVPMVNGQEPTPVTFWTTHSNLGFEALTKITEDFNAANPDTVVTIVQRPAADVEDSSGLITAVRAGEGPDVYLLDRFIVAERAAQGLLQSMTPLQESAGVSTNDVWDNHVPFAAAEATYNNETYAYPFDTDVRALFYNKGLLTEKGVDLAELDPANGPITFARLDELAAMVDTTEGDQFSTVGFVPYHEQGWHYTYGFSYGGEFFDWENCQVTPDNAGVVAGAQWVYDYCANRGADKLFSTVQASRVPGSPPTDNPFNQGRMGFMITGNWQLAGLLRNAPDVDWDFTFIPVPEAGQDSATWAGGWSGVIPQGAKQPEGAFKFVQYLCGPDGQTTYYNINKNLPTLTSVQGQTDLFDEQMTWFIENLVPVTKNRPPIPVGAKYWSELTAAWEAIFLNQQEPAEAYATVKSTVQADLDAGGFCPIAAPEGVS